MRTLYGLLCLVGGITLLRLISLMSGTQFVGAFIGGIMIAAGLIEIGFLIYLGISHEYE